MLKHVFGQNSKNVMPSHFTTATSSNFTVLIFLSLSLLLLTFIIIFTSGIFMIHFDYLTSFVDFFSSKFLLLPAFGHGLGIDKISSITAGDQKVDVFVEMPQGFVDETTSDRIVVTVADSITDQNVNDATLLLGISHNNQTIFRDYFFADDGVLYLDVETTATSNNPTIVGMREGPLNAWQPYDKDEDSVQVNDSVFGASGLYTFDVAIHSVNGISIPDPITYYADLSAIESASYSQTSSDGNAVAFGTKSYFDNIDSLMYDAATNEVVIVMPFDWRETRMSHIPVVHVETHFPKDFLEFYSPGYEGYVNDVKLFKSSVVTDDYTISDERIVHFVLLQDHIRFIKNEMKKTGELFPDTMTFKLKTVEEADFPLVAYTISEDFLVNLSWDPPDIVPDQETTFVFTIRDGQTGEPLRNSDYTFIIMQNDEEIYKKSGAARIGGQFVKFTFTENQTGPTTIKFEDIRGTGQETEFGILVVPELGSVIALIVLAGAMGVVLFASSAHKKYFAQLLSYSASLGSKRN